MPRRFTQRDAAQYIQAMAPEGTKLPGWVNKAASRATNTKPNRREESALQTALCQFLKLYPDILFFSVPNHLWLGQGDPGKQAAYIARQKAQGFLPGVSDLVCIFRNTHGVSVTCFAELKARRGVASDNQMAFQDRANALGCFTAVIKSVDDLKNLLKTAKHPLFTD